MFDSKNISLFSLFTLLAMFMYATGWAMFQMHNAGSILATLMLNAVIISATVFIALVMGNHQTYQADAKFCAAGMATGLVIMVTIFYSNSVALLAVALIVPIMLYTMAVFWVIDSNYTRNISNHYQLAQAVTSLNKEFNHHAA